MPQNITDSATYTATIQSVADGDAATGANFLLGPQGLANRTAFLNAIIGATGTGVQWIRTVANNAALTAIATPSNLSYAVVTGQGLYQYNSASAATVDAITVINGPAGVGRWLWESQAVANSATVGFPVIGAGYASPVNGKLSPALLTNRIVNTAVVGAGSGFTTTSTSFVDVTGATVTLTGAVTGDTIVYHVHFPAYISAGLGNWQAVWLDNGAGGAIQGGQISGAVGTQHYESISWSGPVVTGGNQIVKVQASTANAANTVTVSNQVLIVAQLIRP